MVTLLEKRKSLPFARPVTSFDGATADKSLPQGSARPAGRFIAERPSFSLIRREQYLYKDSISRQQRSRHPPSLRIITLLTLSIYFLMGGVSAVKGLVKPGTYKLQRPYRKSDFALRCYEKDPRYATPEDEKVVMFDYSIVEMVFTVKQDAPPEQGGDIVKVINNSGFGPSTTPYFGVNMRPKDSNEERSYWVPMSRFHEVTLQKSIQYLDATEVRDYDQKEDDSDDSDKENKPSGKFPGSMIRRRLPVRDPLPDSLTKRILKAEADGHA